MRSIAAAVFGASLSTAVIAHIDWIDRSAFQRLSDSWTEVQVRGATSKMDQTVAAIRGGRVGHMPAFMVPFRCNCSWGHYAIEPPSRVGLLSSNLAETIGPGFASCRSVRFDFLSRDVEISSYPAGYFGDHIYRGLLVVDRVRLDSQDDIIFSFRFLADASREDWLDDVLMFEDEPPSEEEFRVWQQFRPDLRVVFEGDDEVSLDVDTRRGEAIVSMGGKWSAIYVHSPTFQILQGLVEKIGTQNAQPGATDNPDDAQRLREDH